MRKQRIVHNIDSLLSLLLLALFGGCILLVLIAGARLYQTQTALGQETYRDRTAAQYFVTRVHQAEGADSVSIAQYGDGDCLIITQTYGDSDYWLLLYCSGGTLREMLVSAGADLEEDFSPESGEELLETGHVSLKAENGLVSGTLTFADGSTSSFTALTRGEKGAQA